MNPNLAKCDECGRIVGFGAHICIANNRPTTNTILSAIARTPGGCWEWTGHVTENGYGIFSFGGLKNRTRIRAHRLAWELFNGSVPNGLCVLHRCDNRKCCNPDHLFLGTRQDNTADMCNKGRQAKGVRNGSHVLNPNQVLEIRTSELPTKALIVAYGVSESVIQNIRSRKAWKHV